VNRQPTLEGELVVGRPLRVDDFAELYAVAADPPLWEQHPESDRWRQEVFRAYFDDHLAAGGALAVVERATGNMIGATRYENHDPEASEVEIGSDRVRHPPGHGALRGSQVTGRPRGR